MNTKENESGIREKEYIQQVVYNEVLYLPVPKLTMEIPIILMYMI